MKKAKVLEIVKSMPKEFDVEEIIEKLVVTAKIEEGMKDIKEGKVIAHEEVVKYFRKKWLK